MATEHLKRLLAEPLAAWSDAPLDASWTRPDVSLARRIEATGGLVDSRFAFCLTLPLAEFTAVAEPLRSCDYRPTRVRPYRDGPLVRVAAVWTRDTLRWSLSLGLRADQVREEAQRQHGLGYWPVDVAAYSPVDAENGPTPLYLAVWSELKSTDEERRMRPGDDVWDVPGKQAPGASYELDLERDEPAALEAGKKSLAAGQRPLTRQRLRRSDGCDWLAQVWFVVPDHPREWPLPETGDGRALQRRLAHRACAWDLALTLNEHAPFEPTYDAIFVTGDGLECAVPHGLTPEAHRVRCLALVKEGYRPVAIAAAGRAEPGQIVTGSVWHRPPVGKGFLFRQDPQFRHARAIAALARLGHPEPLWEALRHGPDPTVRSLLLHDAMALGIGPELLLARLDAQPDVSERRALLLALGICQADAIPAPVRHALTERLLAGFTSDPDPGIHGAIGWLLRGWGQGEEIRRREQGLAAADPPRDRDWYVNRHRQTFAVVRGPVTFGMGEPVRVAVMTTEVTVAQFRPFLEALSQRQPVLPRLRNQNRYDWDNDCPKIRLDWFDAARYCNWLSSVEGVPKEQWCYIENQDGTIAMPEHYLGRTGYRLPTEAEWEFACRAGAITNWPYGRDARDATILLPSYAWSIADAGNRTHPVGAKRPNDLGLFDMLGNAHEWCQDPFDTTTYHIPEPGSPRVDREFPAGLVPEKTNRVLRGGWFHYAPDGLTATVRSWDWAGYINTQDGFRVARTVR